MAVMPRRCACGQPMEWVSRVEGAYSCAHCDRRCTRPSEACDSCRRIKVKR